MNSGKIFVVDDDLEICRSLRAALVVYGYEVTDARSGEEALDKFQMPDLVLLDLKLPGMGGLETYRMIGTYRRCPSSWYR